MPTSMFLAVPTAGTQRDIKSGRGLPTAFLVTSVIKAVKSNLERRSATIKTTRRYIRTQ